MPTGNFGDILAGYYAKQMGLPVGRLVCASNRNNVLTDFLRTGTYDARRTFYKTTSPSMDILISSNLERLLYHVSGSSEKVAGWMQELSATGKYIVDAEPLANASSGRGVDITEVDCSLYECRIDHADVLDAIYTTDINGLDIIPSHIDLVGAEIEMLNLNDREKMIKKLLESIRDEYDYILIDCSPSLGLITVNALTAADSVIIPVQCEYFALEGISKLLNTIKIIKSKLNQKLEIEGFLLTMYDSRLRLANQIYDEVKRHFQELVFKTVIQRNVKLSESPSHGLPVILYDADSTGSKNHLALAKEIINKNK